MPLSQSQWPELLQVAKQAALSAGDIISRHNGQSIQTKEKVGGENLASQIVTEIDLKAQAAILDILNPTLLKYDIGLLTEESTDNNSRFKHNYFWCIDPLDGTLAYSQNEAGHSTSIALVSKEGCPVIAVVYDSTNKSLYYAMKGQGALKNEKPFKAIANSNNLTLLFDQSYLAHPQYHQQIKTLKQYTVEMGFDELVHHPLGGAVMNGISTIELAPALYYKFPKKACGGGSLWDFAASSLIQSEAGGFNSDFHGKPLDLNRKDSTFMNHRGIIYASFKSLLDLIPTWET